MKLITIKLEEEGDTFTVTTDVWDGADVTEIENQGAKIIDLSLDKVLKLMEKGIKEAKNENS
jgi:hypothetical protein